MQEIKIKYFFKKIPLNWKNFKDLNEFLSEYDLPTKLKSR